MIEIVDPGCTPEWDAYVETRAEATLYNAASWGAVARNAYGIQPELILARGPGGAVRGGLMLFVVPRLWQRYVTNGLFGAYAPVLADDSAVRAEILEAACRLADARRAEHLNLKILGEGPAPPRFGRHDLWVTAMLRLDGGAERVWKGLRKSIRAAVRQAERAGLEVRWGHGELDAFYDVLADNMHRKGSPIYGRRFMAETLQAFGRRADVITLRIAGDDKPISGALAVAFKGVMLVPFASSRPEYFKLRPNNLLYWRIIERACLLGLGTLDFGQSIRGTSTLDFKLHWGARMQPVTSYVYTRAAEQPVLVPSTAWTRAVVRAWKAMPRSVADVLGPHVSRIIV